MTSDFPSFTGPTRGTVRAILEQVLTQESRLAASTHDFMWRVRGSPLQSLKRLFEEQGRQLDAWVGELNQRARAIGIAVHGVATAPSHTTLVSAGAEEAPAPREAIAQLLARHEAVLREVRGAVAAVCERDPQGETAAVLTGLLDFHETSAWMLRLVLEKPQGAVASSVL